MCCLSCLLVRRRGVVPIFWQDYLNKSSRTLSKRISPVKMVDCTLGNINAKIFAKAVQTLAKIGTELLVDANKDYMQLRAFNSIQSSIIMFRMDKEFFLSYWYKEDEETYYKISTKCCLPIFRSMRHVERCVIRLTKEKFHVTSYCTLETKKKTSVNILEDINLRTDWAPDSDYNIITAKYKVFHDMSQHFHSAEDELTLEAAPDKVTVKNYVEKAAVNDRFMRSQMTLSPREFDSYEMKNYTSVTFSLKEFRAFLSFAEQADNALILKFLEPGRPIYLEATRNVYVKCYLLMSTLSPHDITLDDIWQREEGFDVSITTRKRKSSKPQIASPSTNPTPTPPATRSAKTPRFNLLEDETLSNPSTPYFVFTDNDSSASTETDITPSATTKPSALMRTRRATTSSSYNTAKERRENAVDTRSSSSHMERGQQQEDLLSSPIPSPSTGSRVSASTVSSLPSRWQETEALEKFLKTPIKDRAKTIKQIFSRCFQEDIAEYPVMNTDDICAYSTQCESNKKN